MRVENARTALLSDFEVLDLMREMDRRHHQHHRRIQQQQQQAASSSSSSGAGADTVSGGVAAADGSSAAANEDLQERVMRTLPPNLRTIQYSVLETLSDLHRPCAHVSRSHIPRFMDALQAWERGRPVPALDGTGGEAPQDGPRQSAANGNGQGHEEGQGRAATQQLHDRRPIERDRRLTKGERLMLINQAPKSLLELYMIVEEADERFTEQERSDLLQLVAALVPVDRAVIEEHDNRLEAESQAQEGQGTGHGTSAAGEVLTNGSRGSGEDVYAGPGDEGDEPGGGFEDGEDIEMLENEGRGEGAVDDDAPDDE